MAKRTADTQLTKDSMDINNSNAWGGVTGPQKANAAQMANRKLAKARGVRRPGGARPVGPGATSSSIQQSFPPFGQTNGVQQSGFSFGQKPATDTQNQTTQSFPPFNMNNGQGDAGSNNSFTAPSSTFDFNAPQSQNPFSSDYAGDQSLPNGGFQGSIFRLDTPTTTSKRRLSGEAKPLFASGAPNIEPTGSLAQSTSTNGFSWLQSQPMAQGNNDKTSNDIFSFPSTKQQQASPSATNSANISKEHSTNIFAGIQSPLVQNDKQTKPDIYTQLTGAPPAPGEDQPTTNRNHLETSKSTEAAKRNPFANIFTPPAQPSTSMFSNIPLNKVQDPASIFSSDAMRTSPDNASQKIQQTPFNPFQFTTQSIGQTQESPTKESNTPSTVSNLFDRIPQPRPTDVPTNSSQSVSNPTPAPAFNNKQPAQPEQPKSTSTFGSPNAGASLFARITQPEKEPSPPTLGQSSEPIAAPAASSSLFERISKPPANSPFTSILGNASTTSANISASVSNTFASDRPVTESNPPNFDLMSSKPSGISNQGLTTNMPSVTETAALGTPTSQKIHTGSALPAKNATASALSNVETHQGPEDVPQPPTWFTEEERKEVFVGWRLKQLDVGMQSFKSTKSNQIDMDILELFYEKRKASIIEAGDGPVKSLVPAKRQAADRSEADGISKKPKHNPALPVIPISSQDAATDAVNITPTVVGRSLPTSSITNTKRKASDELTRNGPTIEGESVKRTRGVDFTPKSQTSNLFSSIIDSGQEFSSPQRQPSTANESAAFSKPSALSDPFQTNPNLAMQHSTIGTPSLFRPADGNTTVSALSASKPAATPILGLSKQPRNSEAELETSGSSVFNALGSQPTLQVNNSTPLKLKQPTFSTSSSTNFMAQFGEAAKKEAEAAKKKRKAEEYDSEEDDEAEWEKKDEEQQHLKKQKISEAAKTAKPFIPSFMGQSTSTPSEKSSGSNSIFDQIHPIFGHNNQSNMFGHLGKQGGTPDASITAHVAGLSGHSADETDKGASEDDPPPPHAARSLFDRISKPETNSNDRSSETSEDSPSADHTWKVDSPIKFGTTSNSSSMPSLSLTAASPSKAPATGLFGAPNGMSEATSKPGASTTANLATEGNAVGFDFGPAKGTGFSLAPQSNNASRATSPGATTGESANESANEARDDAASQQEQLDLISQRAGEENEDVLYEVRAKALKFDPSTKSYITKGVGPLRVLKQRETGNRRIILRMDPGGSLVVNSAFIKEFEYQHVGASTVRCCLQDQTGQAGIWQLRLKTNDLAKDLAKILNENKELGI